MIKGQMMWLVRVVIPTCHFGFWGERVFRLFPSINLGLLLHFFLSRLADVSRYLLYLRGLQSQRHSYFNRFESLFQHATLDPEGKRSLDCFHVLTWSFYCTSFSPGLPTFRGIYCALGAFHHKDIAISTGLRLGSDMAIWIIRL